MSATKVALKAAKAALDARKYEEAIEEAKAVISFDAANYNAYVFLGLAYEKQDHSQTSEDAYRKAIQVKDEDILAWQGLVTLYEKQKGDRLDAYHDAALKLAELFSVKDDKYRCQSVLDKYTGDVKKYGTRAQVRHSLDVYLPTGPLYDYLEGRVPPPASTYARIAELVELDEKEKINAEIGQRRTRLGAKIDQVTSDVNREVLERSQLEALYGAIIDWSHDDETRRQYEEKLLQRAYDHLIILPGPKKEEKRGRVQKLAEGLVILKHPFLLAWRIKLEWDDHDELQDMDVGLLREYISLFPDDGLSKVLQGFLSDEISPFPKPECPIEDDHEQGEDLIPMSAEDRLILMTEGLAENPSSPLAYRVMGQYYLHLEEPESAVTTARLGCEKIQIERNISGLSLRTNLDAIETLLATALVQYQAPRNHPEATELFQGILRRRPTETAALLGIGLILEEQQDYARAVNFLDRAKLQSNDPRIRAEAAWCKALKGDEGTSLHELNLCLLEMKGSDSRMRLLRSQTLYRIGMCQWNINPSRASRKNRDGPYSMFIASLQADMNFAPAYTSLGLYYADYANDKKRARKCFQKAFELSSSEVVAAERLAGAFAKSSDWDLVEAVAQRVVESGKVKPAPGSKKKACSWPFAALGVVQLTNQEYTKSIVSFQSALRIAPEDYHCWVGLGESYQHSGRYIAAAKAFEQTQKLEIGRDADDNEESWFSQYMLSNVKRELGDFENAIAGYQAVLKIRPTEYGVGAALLQTLVEGAWHFIELGYFGRAGDVAREAIELARDVLKIRANAFNLWKAIGDACSVFTYLQTHASTFPTHDLKSLLETDKAFDAYEALANVDGIGQAGIASLTDDPGGTDTLKPSTTAAILAQKRAIHACSNDVHARAVAWYNLGWTEYRAHECNERHTVKSPLKKSKYLKASVQCFKKAIELEARNAEFWNSLGIVTTELNPKVSQHAFVRSLYLNDKNARVWTNLGALYLIQDDCELANYAFTSAQSSDPDYAPAWVGQGLLATRLSDPNEARKLYIHAFEIANSSLIMIKGHFAAASFDKLSSSQASASVDNILKPLFALRQLRSQVSSDAILEHLLSLFAERTGDFKEALSSLELVTSNLESEYEESESPMTLMRFAQAKADMGRAQLALGLHSPAAETVETALSLCDDESWEENKRQRVRLSAHMTAGLAYYNQGLMDEAIDMFRTALEETSGDPDIVCLLARLLWAKGGEEERNVAREQLFDCMENHPGHVDAITLLGAIAVLDRDQDTAKAIVADLGSLITQDSVSTRRQIQLSRLLMIIATVFSTPEDREEASRKEATTTIMLAPAEYHGWTHLSDHSNQSYPAEMAIVTALRAVPPQGDLDADELSKCYAGTRRIDDAQRAIMVAPFKENNWEFLMV